MVKNAYYQLDVVYSILGGLCLANVTYVWYIAMVLGGFWSVHLSMLTDDYHRDLLSAMEWNARQKQNMFDSLR